MFLTQEPEFLFSIQKYNLAVNRYNLQGIIFRLLGLRLVKQNIPYFNTASAQDTAIDHIK